MSSMADVSHEDPFEKLKKAGWRVEHLYTGEVRLTALDGSTVKIPNYMHVVAVLETWRGSELLVLNMRTGRYETYRLNDYLGRHLLGEQVLGEEHKWRYRYIR